MNGGESRRGVTPLLTTTTRRVAGSVLVALLLAGAVVFYRAAPKVVTATGADPTPSLPAGSTPLASTSAGSTALRATPPGSPPVGSTPAGSATVGSTPARSATAFSNGTASTSSPVQPSPERPSPTRVAPTGPVTTPPTSRGPASTAVGRTSSPTSVNSRPITGPGITEPGIHLTASPAFDGSFDVSEQVLLSQPQTELSLRVPPISQAGNEFRSAAPVATTIQVTAGDQPVVLPSDTLRDAVTLTLGSSEKRFELRYRLTGVTIRSIPSTAGRALAAIGPLTDKVADDLPVAVTVSGSGVRNLECRQLILGARACATGELPDLRVNRLLRWPQSIVVVQLDLSSS